MRSNKNLELKSLIKNIKGIRDSRSLLETLMDFERIIDEFDIYAFDNWKKGELVEGPVVSRHWVSATFMWPKHLPPNPLALARLENNGIIYEVTTAKFKSPKPVKTAEDFIPGTHYPRVEEKPVWLIELTIPKNMIRDIEEGYANIAGEIVELEDIDDAYSKDYDNEGLTNNTAEDFTE